MSRSSLAAMFVTLFACAPPPAKQFEIVRPLSLQRCAPAFTTIPLRGTGVVVAGRSVVLEYAVTAFLDCDFGRQEVERITVELIDDAGAPIEAQVEIEGRGFNRLVRVTFAAAEGGVHLRLVAEPTIGVFSQSLRALRFSNRSWTELPMRSCDGLVDGPGGESLCVNRGQLEFANRAVPAHGVAVTESMVWLMQLSAIEGCFVDGGTAVRVPIDSRPWAVAARGRQVAAVWAGGITVVDETGRVRTVSFPPEALLPQAIAFFDDDTLLTSRPGGFDRVSLDGSVPARPFAGQVPVQRMSDEGLWSIDSNETLTLHRFDGGLARVQGFGVPPSEGFALPDEVPLLRPGGTIDLVGIPIPAPDGGLSIDLVELPPDLGPSWLTSKWLFARHRVTRTLWMTPRVP